MPMIIRRFRPHEFFPLAFVTTKKSYSELIGIVILYALNKLFVRN